MFLYLRFGVGYHTEVAETGAEPHLDVTFALFKVHGYGVSVCIGEGDFIAGFVERVGELFGGGFAVCYGCFGYLVAKQAEVIGDIRTQNFCGVRAGYGTASGKHGNQHGKAKCQSKYFQNVFHISCLLQIW